MRRDQKNRRLGPFLLYGGYIAHPIVPIGFAGITQQIVFPLKQTIQWLLSSLSRSLTLSLFFLSSLSLSSLTLVLHSASRYLSLPSTFSYMVVE